MENHSHYQKPARVMALINRYNLSINPNTSTSRKILNPMFPTREACQSDSTNTISGKRFGITSNISDTNCVYKELPTMKFCVYTLYQLAMIILSFVLNTTSLKTYYHS